MPVVRVDALCECEGCQKRFGVELDIGENLMDEYSVGGSHMDYEQIVREHIRGGQAAVYTWGVRGKATIDRMSLSYSATIQADLMLCDICSRKCCDMPIEGNLTREQVNEALGLPVETT